MSFHAALCASCDEPPSRGLMKRFDAQASKHALANWMTDPLCSSALCALRFSLSKPCFHAEREPVAASSPEYDSARVAAYASSRMPACYAVLFRVFDELHLHLPHFAPRTMLDFGSGPGTAIWAAREVSLVACNSDTEIQIFKDTLICRDW